MNTKTLLLLCSFFFSVSISAQFHTESKEKIKTLKIAFLTEQLNLTTKEAQQFWPIYNKYDEEQHTLRIKLRTEIGKFAHEEGNIDGITEIEAERLIDLKLKTDQRLFEAQKELISKIKPIISHKKILKLQIAEREFGRKLMRKYKQKKNR